MLEKNVRVRAARPLFRPSLHKVWVVVRPVRLSRQDVLPVGTELRLGDLPRFKLRSLYQRRRIGVKDDAWTNYMLQQQEFIKVEEEPEPHGEEVEVEIEEEPEAPVDEE